MQNKHFAQNVSTYFVANVLNGIIPFLLLPILTRFLTVESYGQVALFQSLYWAISAFVGITIAGASDRKYFEISDTQHLSDFIGVCFQICLCLTIATSCIFYFFQAEFSSLFGIAPQYIFIAIIVAASISISQIRLGQWQARGQSLSFGIFQVLQSALIVLIATLLIVVFNFNELGRILAQVMISGIFALAAIYLLYKDKLLNFFIWSPKYIKEVLSFAIPLIPHVGGVFLISMADRFFIAKDLGVANAGIYMLAAQLATIVSLFHESLNRAFQPWLFAKLTLDKLEDKKTIVKYTYVWFLVILASAPIFFLIGPVLVGLIAGPEYAQAGRVFGWLALGHSFGGMYAMLNSYLYFSKKTYSLSIVTLFSGVLNIILLVYFLKYFGIIGAGIAFSISMLVRFFLTWFSASFMHPMPWFSFYKKN